MVGGECGFTRTGFIQLVKARENEYLKANVAMQQRVGIPTFLLTPADIHRLAPTFFVDDFEMAAYEPESGYADPTSSARSLMDAARRLGARLVQDCRVTAVNQVGGRVVGVESTQGSYSAPIVVDAAGAWAAPVARMAGVDIPVNTWRHETLFLRRPKDFGPPHPTVIDHLNTMYFRPETGGLTLVGLEDGNTFGESPEDNTGKARPGFAERAVERICRRIPVLENGSLHSTQAGFDGITPDGHALLGPAGPEGLYLDCGFSGTGFKLAPAVGASLAEWVVDGHPATIDITPLSVERLEKGFQLRGEHPYSDHF
jgi:sarcosine oxidase subunit beta